MLPSLPSTAAIPDIASAAAITLIWFKLQTVIRCRVRAHRSAHVPGLKRAMLRNCAKALGNGILDLTAVPSFPYAGGVMTAPPFLLALWPNCAERR